MLDSYYDLTEELLDECSFCGESCDGRYCSRNCKKAYEAEN